MLRQIASDIRARNADLDEDEVARLIDEELGTTRTPFWPTRGARPCGSYVLLEGFPAQGLCPSEILCIAHRQHLITRPQINRYVRRRRVALNKFGSE